MNSHLSVFPYLFYAFFYLFNFIYLLLFRWCDDTLKVTELIPGCPNRWLPRFHNLPENRLPKMRWDSGEKTCPQEQILIEAWTYHKSKSHQIRTYNL